MCFLLFALNAHPDYALIIAGNRDEFHYRPTRPAQFWQRYPDIVAGKDEQHGGTWLGLNRNGQFACLTNYRSSAPAATKAPSRGELVINYLNSASNAEQFCASLRPNLQRYDGFNMVLGSVSSLRHISNRTDPWQQALDSGLHGISNGALNEDWPKVKRGRHRLGQLLKNTRNSEVDVDKILLLLADRQIAADDELPDTGVGLERERILSPVFIDAGSYGTRCSTVIAVRTDGFVSFTERSFDANGNPSALVTKQFYIEKN